MGDLIGGVVSLGLGVAVSPLPVIAVFMILSSSTVAAGTWFLSGRIIALTVITAVLAPFTDAIDDAAGSTAPAAIGRLIIGSGLLIWSVVKLVRHRTAPRAAGIPSWLRAADGLTGRRALTAGLLVSAVNLKEVALAGAAGVIIGGAMLETGPMVLGVVVFVVVACSSVAVPLVAMALLGDRVRPVLSRARDWLIVHNAVVMASVLLVIGALLLLTGVADLL